MSKMYGIVVCGRCGRKRIIDLGTETSSCPYCSAVSKTPELKVLFSDKSQSVVRKAFESADAPKYAEPEKKKNTNDPDPMETLMYRYERAADVHEKLTILAEGLTKIKGSFGEKDINELFPGKGEKFIKMMMSADIIIELGYGKFKAI